AWRSMRPSTTPRGVGNFCDDRMTASGNTVVYSSSSGTVAGLWTWRKWAASTAFSAISWQRAAIADWVQPDTYQMGSSSSGTSGTSHIGSSPWGWYQANTRPLRSTVG